MVSISLKALVFVLFTLGYIRYVVVPVMPMMAMARGVHMRFPYIHLYRNMLLYSIASVSDKMVCAMTVLVVIAAGEQVNAMVTEIVQGT